MDPPTVSAELYTHWHRILGRFAPGPTGVFGFLNLPTRSSVKIEGASINRLSQPAKLVARFPWLWLVKSQILAVLLSSRAEVGVTAVSRGGYSRVVRTGVHVVLGDYEVRGVVETPGKLDFDSMFFEGDTLFYPIYNATIESVQFPGVQAEAAGLLFNKEKVVAAAVVGREES